MNCRLCGTAYPDVNAPAFCSHCGTRLVRPADASGTPPLQPPPAPFEPPRQPPAHGAAAAYGGTIDRARLRAMILARRRRKKKLLMMAVPTGALVIAAAALTLFLLSGKGMTPEEYKAKSLAPLKQAITSMKGLEEQWEASEVNDDPYSECYEDLVSEAEDVLEDIREAMRVQAAIGPPREMELLDQELNGFYLEASDFLAEATSDFAYAAKWAKVMEEWGGTDTAMSQWSDDTSFETTIELFNQDIGTMDGYINELSSLDAPERFKTVQEKSLALMAELRELLERMKRSLISRDESDYFLVQADWDTFDATYDGRYDDIWESFDDFRDQYYDLVDGGKDLVKQLGGGRSSDTSSARLF